MLGLNADPSCSRQARGWKARASARASSAYVDVHHQEALLDFGCDRGSPSTQAAGTGLVELCTCTVLLCRCGADNSALTNPLPALADDFINLEEAGHGVVLRV